MRIEKPAPWPLFFIIFDNSRAKDGQALSCTFAPRLYNSSGHCPCTRPAHVAESRPLARLQVQVLQNSGSRMFMLRVKTLLTRDRHWRNLREKTILSNRLLSKSLNRKLKLVHSKQVSSWLWNIEFHLRPLWLQTLVAIDSESCQRSFPSFWAPPSEVAELFDWNLSRRLFLPMPQFYSNEW